MNRAAAKVHDVMLVLEPAMLGAGLVTGAAPGQAPDVVLDAIAEVVGTIFGDCITVTSATDTVSLRIEFGADGCGFPTRTRVSRCAHDRSGGRRFVRFALTFEQFRVGGSAPLDGAIGITFVDDSTISFLLHDLVTAPGDAIDIEGTLVSSRVHTVATLTGTGEVEVDGTRYALSVTDLERHIGTDCYPEDGVISARHPRRERRPADDDAGAGRHRPRLRRQRPGVHHAARPRGRRPSPRASVVPLSAREPLYMRSGASMPSSARPRAS